MDKSYTPLSESELIKSDIQETPRKKTTLQDLSDALDSYDPIKTDLHLIAVIFWAFLPISLYALIPAAIENPERWWEPVAIVVFYGIVFFIKRLFKHWFGDDGEKSEDE